MPDTYERRFRVLRVIDGDTIVAGSIDLGYHVATMPGIEFRLLRCDTPETNRAASKTAGYSAKAFTVKWVTDHALHDDDGWLFARSEKTDVFGRYLAEVSCGAGHNLSDDLLSSGHAVPFTK